MCGIFAFLNHLVPRTREEIIKILIGGLKRLEYRGYDSAGIALLDDSSQTVIYKEVGLVAKLEEFVARTSVLPTASVFEQHEGIAHTRWATHGPPSTINSHPHRSDEANTFVVVHNGIVNNYKELKTLLQSKGHVFESDTDTEVIAKLYLDQYTTLSSGTPRARGRPTFAELTNIVMSILTGAFAILVTSSAYPHELIGAKVGSPLIVGVRFASDVHARGEPASRSLERVASVKAGGGAHGAGGLAIAAPASSAKLSLAVARAATLGAGPSPGASAAVPALAPSIPRGSSLSEILRLSGTNEPTFPTDHSAPAAAAAAAAVPVVAMPPSAAAAANPNAVEYYVSSDASAIVEYTSNVIFMEDYQIAHFADGDCVLYNCPRDGDGVVIPSGLEAAQQSLQKLSMALEAIQKGAFKYFMQKEIFEQVDSIPNTLRGRLGDDCILLGGLKEFLPELRRARRYVFIACGTSYHSGLAARPIMEELVDVPVTCESGSDFLDRQSPIFRDDVCFFISQSGETADVIRTLKYCKARGALCVGITNTVGSAIARDTHCGVNVNAGPEIGVASTKAYTSQCLVLIMIAVAVAQDSKAKTARCREILADMHRLPELVAKVLRLDSKIQGIAEAVKSKKSMLVLGRGWGYATAVEGALKVKELTYLHCEGVLAGELKHGTLALVDADMPIVAVATRDNLYNEIRSSLAQVCARGGRPIVICTEGDEMEGAYEVTLAVPGVVNCLQNVLNIIPLQLLAFHIADKLGLDVDRPRNLSKSVTVQ